MHRRSCRWQRSTSAAANWRTRSCSMRGSTNSLARWRHNRSIMISENSLPPEQTNRACWYGPDWTGREDEWTYHFSREEIAELERAAEQWNELHSSQNIETTLVDDFPLPTLAPKLLALCEELI